MELFTLEDISVSIAKAESSWSRLSERENSDKKLRQMYSAVYQGKLQTYNRDSGDRIDLDTIKNHKISEFWTTKLDVDEFFKSEKNTALTNNLLPLTTGNWGRNYAAKQAVISPANYEHWLKADLWTVERGILLLLGAEFMPYGEYGEREFYQAYQDKFNKVWAIAKSSLKTGVLKKIGKSYPSLSSEVLPGDFINWARLKGYSIPIELEAIEPMTQAETVKDAGTVSKGDKIQTKSKGAGKTKRTRKVNLSRAIDAAIETFGKKPSLDELWQFFQNERDETGIIEDFTDTHITWKDTKGKLHDTQKETIANHLSRIKS